MPEAFVELSGVFFAESILHRAPELLRDIGTDTLTSSLKTKKTAVITDATSPDFFFPRWRRYYGRLFGHNNLHVVTYAGLGSLFQAAGVGNIWEVNSSYSDRLRVRIIANLTATLLQSYDVVLHCDVDEFLVPDPSDYEDLADYVERCDLCYVTAHGVDVIELSDDPMLDPDTTVLFQQRRYGLRTTALNKTALTKHPLRWAEGFHGANVFPKFFKLYNFHLKRADFSGRLARERQMLGILNMETQEYNYFSPDIARQRAAQNSLNAMEKSGAETAEAFERRYLDGVAYDRLHDIYHGAFLTQDFLFLIDKKFDKLGMRF